MRCKLKRVIYQAAGGFCVFSYVTQDQSVPAEARNTRFMSGNAVVFTAVGYNLPATDTIEVELNGQWQPSKYGMQLNVESCEQLMPADNAGLVAYLSSGFIKGIGPKTAKAIVARFGDNTLEVLENEPNQLLSVKGIAKGKLERIVRSYRSTRKLRDLAAYLAPYEVSEKKIVKISEEFGDNALSVVKSDPFQLCRIRGFGFLTVDAIARKTKVSLRNPLRYAGAINFALEEARKSGNLFLLQDVLAGKCYELLNRDCETEVVSSEEIRQAVQKSAHDGGVYIERERVYLAFERLCEVKTAQKVVSILTNAEPPEFPNLDDEITQSETVLQRRLSPTQRSAVEVCLTNQISIMTGGPGTGKTTTLKVILDIYHRNYPQNEIILAAPTGKASRRMSEQTGFPASTLHSALGIVSDEDIEDATPEMLSADLIVIDEMSMVDMHLAYALMTRIKPGVQLLLVGDPDQLPSVGPGNVLRELIRSELIPVAVLDTVFRQASNSRIALNAYAVNHNDTRLMYGDDFIMLDADTSENAQSLVLKYYFDEVSAKGVENVQIRADYGILFNLSGENAELADTDLSGSSPEEYKRSVARSKKILHAMVDALELIKENPDRGDEMYEVLYQTYFTPQKPRNREVILKQLAIKGYPISSSQYHAWLKESISAIDELLWGFTAKGSPEFASLLSDT